MDCDLPRPRAFTLQWHITERCNWRCKHCYQEETIKEELTTDQLFDVLKQYSSLIKKWELPQNLARLNISGGEPLIRQDFFQIIEEIKKYRGMFRWGILSNGSFITRKIAKKLKESGISDYQVSLEGLEKNNDKTRGEGSFKKISKLSKS